jgi:RND family efflux transporter MFP subunit
MAKVGVLLYGKTLITVLLLGLVTSGCSRKQPPNAGPPPGVPVKLQRVESSTVEDSSEFVGSLEAQKRVELRPETEGRVRQIFVGSGTRVAAGTQIAQLRSEKGQAEVGGAIANVNASRAARDNAQAQISAQEAERKSALADLELQNQQFNRISRLVSQGALARQQLDQVIRDREAARAALNAAEERIRAARASLDEANAALKQAQATATLRTEELAETRVVAPIAGVVGDVPVKVGAYVETNDILTTIIQNDTLELDIPIPITRSSELRIGTPVQLLSNTQDNEILANGRISFISPQVNSQSQGVLAKASFANTEGTLRDGQDVKAKVIWERSTGVLIPTTAIAPLAGQDFVFVAQTQQTKEGKSQLVARQKPVKLDKENIQDNKYPVIEGVKPGETLVTSGVQNLTDGAPIIPQS